MSFVHLHVHSVYSLLDGYSNVNKLIQRAREMDMPAVGLTDHGTMFGVIEFYNAASKAGVKPIIGVEAYMAARTRHDRDARLDKKSSHILLLAENETGYKNLLKLSSAAQLEGFYYNPRIDRELLAAHSEGLICTSGCMSAEIPRALLEDNPAKARQTFDWYYEVFGPDHFFVELQNHDIPEIPALNQSLLDLSKRYSAGLVATNDVHYVDPGDARLQDILLAIQTGCVLTDPKRLRMTDDSYYLRTPQEMERLFGHLPGAISNTLAIAERCQLDLGFKGYKLPLFDVPEGYTPQSYLRELCEQGLQRLYGEASDSEAVRSRLEYELGIIHQMGFDAYFLIVWDLCKFARQEGIWYNARGSAAGSIVAYCLDITMVNPLAHGLIFERFLNPGRISMPDIDLDFQDDMRAKMMQYCADKYGHDKVAQIITFGTLKARAAVRDVGRVMDIPLNEVDRVAKLIPAIPGKKVTIESALEEVPELRELYDSETYMQELLDTAQHMEGVVRNAGTHAAGVVITDKPIVEYVPLHRPTSNSSEDLPVKVVTQFEMSVVDALGLLKVDFLGLVTLTIMSRACEFIRKRHGVDLDLHSIPLDDPKSFELLGRGETAGVFQVEGAGMRRNLIQMKPHNLDNVVAMIALYRPGPLEFIPTYIRRMHGEETTEYRHPALEPVFEETYGIPVYQEQLMRAAVELAGYTASEADDLRKAIAKKIKEKLMKHRDKFVKGAAKNGIPEETGHQIFNDWEEFARYGFNKSHAVDYGMIAVQTAYLKEHYPVEYMTALLSACKNDTGKVALYVADCRRMGMEVLAPDVNLSGWDFTIEDDDEGTSAIRFGLGAVKNVGHAPVEAILKARESTPFLDINDFIRRVDLRVVGKRALECLIRVGALDSFGPRVALLESLERMVAISAVHFRAAEIGQMSMFGPGTGIEAQFTLPEIKGEIDQREMLNWERELIGLYVTDHPLAPYMEELSRAVSYFSGELPEATEGEKVRVAGLVCHLRRHITKSGKPMAFATIEDIQGTIDLVLFPRTWRKFSELIQDGKVILVEGTVDVGGAEPKILVDRVTTEFTFVTHLDSATAPGQRQSEDKKARPRQRGAASRNGSPSPAPENPQTPESRPGPPGVGEPPAGYDDGAPEEPPDWQIYAEPPLDLDDTLIQELPEPGAAPHAPRQDSGEKAGSTVPPETSKEETPVLASQGAEEIASPPVPVPHLEESQNAPQFILSPETIGGENPPKMVTVILRTNGDKLRDSLKIQRVHGLLISYPGVDRFAFYVFEGESSYLIEFPNFTTHICDELLARLHEVVSPESVKIEPIIYQ